MLKYCHDILEASVSLKIFCWCSGRCFEPSTCSLLIRDYSCCSLCRGVFYFQTAESSLSFPRWSQQTAWHTTSWLWHWHFHSSNSLCQQKCEAYYHVTVNHVWEYSSCWLDSYHCGSGGGETAKTPSIATSDLGSVSSPLCVCETWKIVCSEVNARIASARPQNFVPAKYTPTIALFFCICSCFVLFLLDSCFCLCFR